MPEAAPLALMRASIDRKPKNIRRVLTDANLRKHLLGGAPSDEKKAIKAFCSQNAENALKTKPKVSRSKAQCDREPPWLLASLVAACRLTDWLEKCICYCKQDCVALVEASAVYIATCKLRAAQNDGCDC